MLIAVACDEDVGVALDVAEGQRNDALLAKDVLIEARDAVGSIREVLGDKGYHTDAVLDELDALPAIPQPEQSQGLPWPWDDEMREIYKRRNRVERAFA